MPSTYERMISTMEHEISVEQKAHDLAVAYATYLMSNSDKEYDLNEFYQEYENAYIALFPLVKRNS